MQHKDKTVYRGRFSGLHIEIFGVNQVLAGDFDIQIVQHRANPPLWLAAPTAGGKALWRGGTVEIVMKRVLQDFDRVIEPFYAVTPQGHVAPRLSPAPQRSAPDEKAG